MKLGAKELGQAHGILQGRRDGGRRKRGKGTRGGKGNS